ncbi:uncharacterized protein LOC119612880 isoform X2 [Lucilia sericata]|uniref:uncharacterized protein LOC119612880 isoform X2 n=1 Tax=Lucilia sericata TaxID=13632 RepID=UPI0018A84ACA|nr:uncharacterized protein LOC119612880 isoform X2 [Lucilia sericata]
MLFLSVSSSLMLIYLLLALCCNIHSAPTHHLTIGVQGNTPTLIVTSSEIGITPETMGSLKKPVKHENTEKKSLKTKLNKNHSVFDKKEKLQYPAKPLNKYANSEEKSFEVIKSAKSLSKQTSLEEKSYEVMKSIEKQENKEKMFKKLKQTKHNTETLKDQETTTQNLFDFKTTMSVESTTTNTENVDIYQTNLQLTSLTPTQSNDIQSVTSYTTVQPEELSTTTPQANTDKISPTPLKFEDVDDLKNPPALSTSTLNPKDFNDITTAATTTINYEDGTITATNSKALTKTQTETEANVAVDAQSEQTTQIVQNTTVIKTEYENDSNIQDPVATEENENLLLTTIETKAFNTPTTTTTAITGGAADASSSSPTFVTLITDNAEATTTTEMLSIPLTMTTTENVVDDDNNNNDKKKEQQLTTIEYSETATHTATTEVAEKKREKDKETENPVEAESQSNKNSGITIKPKQEYTLATTTKEQTENDDFKSTENPVQAISVATNQDNVSEQNEIVTETITETEDIVTTTNSTPLTITEQQQQSFSTFKTQQKDLETTTEAATTEPTTEAVLKLIDLEKHVLKTIDELKQPSSLLMAGQHDNGHDGLKNIKKKQLIDKHYVEALLHNKHDVHVKDSAENEKYLPLTTTAPTLSPSIAATSTTTTNKPLLMPIKHGYLGPILMEEKTFHVIHHADKAMASRQKHLAEIEAQLRKGNFVELKANTEVSEATKEPISDNIKENLDIKNLSMEMQSDQPAQNSETYFEIKENIEDLKNNKENDKLTLKKTQANAADTLDIISKTEPTLDNQQNTLTTIKIPTAEDIATLKSLQESKHSNSNIISPMNADEIPQDTDSPAKSASVLSTTVFQVIDSMATKTPMLQANTLFTSEDKEKPSVEKQGKEQTESKISDIQIEVYDSTIDSIIASTNFKDGEQVQKQTDESSMGKTTKPPIAAIQQERFTQYVIDRTETSTQEPINYSTIQLANGKPEPAAIEIHINVSESFGNESEDLEFSYPQSEYNNNNNNERLGDESYDDSKVNDNIKLKIPSNTNNNGKDLRNDEILVVEIIDTDNITDSTLKLKSKNNDELFISDVKELYTTPPPPPPPPPYQTGFDRDSDTIFYISNTEVKVGESLPNNKNANEERKLKLESQFFPANYMASTHPNVNSREEINVPHHLYEEDIILSSSRNQADSLKIYRNRNEPSPPLDVTYVGESIIEVEQSPDSVITTTDAPDQQHNAAAAATPQADVIIQPAILPEISIGVPVIGELPPQIELKEIDFMPNEAQLHRSGIYDDNDNSNGNNNNNIMFNNDIDENTISGGGNSNHDIDVVNSNGNNNNQRVDESSIQYGGDLIDESADGGFDGVEGSYPFGNPATIGKSSSSHYSSAFLTKLRKQQQQQQPNHVADYAHLYVNYGVNNMRKDELSADVKDSGELLLIGGVGNGNVASNEQNITSFKDFLNKVSMSNSSMPFLSANTTQNERMSNATAFSVMEDANDLEDKNTDIINLISLAIGLFIVILPVVVTCSMFWALRYLYKKYHSNLTDSGGYTDQTETKTPLNEDGVEKGEFVHEPSSSPTNSNKDAIEKYPDTSNKPSTTETNVKFSTEKPTSHLETTIIKTNTTTTTTATTNSKANDTLKLSLALSSPITQEQAQLPPPTSASSPSKVTCTSATITEQILTVHGDVNNENGAGDDDDVVEMPGPNGSITKMTMENNLLIVETEESNDISRVARETKMDYNKDGVFVVEVARGIDSKTIPESPVTDGSEKMLSMFETKHNNGGLGYKVTNEKNCVNNEKVQIHSPPPENGEEGPRSLHQIEELEEPTNSPQLNENNDEEIAGLKYKANTGLSQSDLSTTSSSDSNKGYCYGNQELYVVEQSGYAASTPNGNVVLKCDVKDIKDDDRNPGNDHYLKHSPDKKEESKDQEDVVETTKKPQEGGTRTSSGESPAQKQNDKPQENGDNIIETENIQNLQQLDSNNSEINKEKGEEEEVNNKQLENVENSTKSELENPAKIPTITQNIPIPVEIEVHITPADMESSNTDETSTPLKSTITADSPVLEATESVTEPLILETIPVELEDNLAVETLLPIETTIPLNETTSALLVEEDETGNSISDDLAILAVPDRFSDKETSQEDISSIKAIENDAVTLENTDEPCETEAIAEVPTVEKQLVENMEEQLMEVKEEVTKPKSIVPTVEPIAEVPTVEEQLEENAEEQLMEEITKPISVNGEETTDNSTPHINGVSESLEAESEKTQDLCTTQNGIESNEKSPLHIKGEKETELTPEDGNTGNEPHKTESQNGLTQSHVESLTNGTSDLVKSPQIQNGHAEIEPISITLNDMENGYDSIMSLPEPPPTTDEQLNSDLSEQQLDSLPPPPPPEIFNLKDLPPPLTNGNADSPQSEESTNFYNTLPPPPPTTLEVTASAETTTTATTNGKVHASPLTPPASPPAHFTNNLHAGLCSQPIAVDVNGS